MSSEQIKAILEENRILRTRKSFYLDAIVKLKNDCTSYQGQIQELLVENAALRDQSVAQ